MIQRPFQRRDIRAPDAPDNDRIVLADRSPQQKRAEHRRQREGHKQRAHQGETIGNGHRRKDFSGLEIELVKGNHDILENDWYTRQGIRLHTPYLDLGPFRFIHDQNDQDESDDQHYTLSGHLHPGISLKEIGRAHV